MHERVLRNRTRPLLTTFLDRESVAIAPHDNARVESEERETPGAFLLLGGFKEKAKSTVIQFTESRNRRIAIRNNVRIHGHDIAALRQLAEFLVGRMETYRSHFLKELRPGNRYLAVIDLTILPPSSEVAASVSIVPITTSMKYFPSLGAKM